MSEMKLYTRRWLAGSVGVTALAGALLAAVAGSGTPAMASHGLAVHQARPHAVVQQSADVDTTTTVAGSYPVTAFSQQFNVNKKYFCPAGTGNAPCDGNGAANDYGTIDRVLSGFSNGGYGNYAPATKALTGDWMALVSGTGDGNLGVGCPGTTPTSNPGEACTGPFALFGSGAAAGAENVFPKKGFTVTDDLYLSPTTAGPAGSLVDDDVELNTSAGGYGIDNIITACAESTGDTAGDLGFVINFGHSSAGSCTGTPVITKDGWYRFVFDFSDVSGNAMVTESVLSDPGSKGTPALIAGSNAQNVNGTSSTPISQWGGPGYFWLPTEDFSGLPLANFALQLGNVPAGNTP